MQARPFFEMEDVYFMFVSSEFSEIRDRFIAWEELVGYCFRSFSMRIRDV